MSDDLNQLADDYWAAILDVSPTWRHLLGDYSAVGRYEQCSREAEQQNVAALRSFASRAHDLDPAGLDEEQGLTREVIAATATASADLADTPHTALAANPISGPQIQLPLVLGLLSVPDAAVAEQMPAKLDGVGTWLRQVAQRVRDGAADGWVSPEFAVRQTIEQIQANLARPVEDDPAVAAVRAPDGVDAGELHARLREAVEQSVRPGLAEFQAALEAVVDQAPPEDRCGLSWLDGGDETYTAALRYFTTTDKSAEEIHEIGLAQLAALADEYRGLGPEVVGSDDLAQIFAAMRTDPALHFTDAGELVAQSKVALTRAEAEMGAWFEVVPRASCAVQGTEVGAKAFYFPPAADGSRGGTFFVNTADPTAWGRFELEAMAFHEGVPGHHLQLAIAAELPDSVPEFRKHLHSSAYAEGWGLYTERLSDEMGLYSSPMDRMGMLSADSMRACRLVVDTGLHALGWSRQQAIDYMVANSPLTEGVCRPEVDRYICNPGQATSYMVGRLEIQRMRREAEQRQGDRFDVRRFHTAVLRSGSLPLGVLDRVVAQRLA
ncbi:MAG TPA: DUF885 domain-containing protein [Nocardioides sp.]|uniref:DUF885 domain-containing protein n=1 Tax=Nocardioides sp. TaxID=35761 RepID=UPI002E339B55|nr:DUF885 domain-containing protein [Nocardioides sp.]HEX3929989.1 DUF885 domain-containing protein [Nocardioides sp.]